jgi:methanethiol S-methyltransferase
MRANLSFISPAMGFIMAIFAPMNWIAFLPLVFAWLVYYSLHSALLHERIQEKFTQWIPQMKNKYRLWYNGFSVAFLIPVIFTYYNTPNDDLSDFENPFLTFMSVLVVGGGLYIMLKSLQALNINEFIGLEEGGNEGGKEELQTEGLYELVRHPMYFGMLLFLFGAMMYNPSSRFLLTAVISALYIFVGARFEEKKLVKKFGKAYQKYQSEVPMLIPFT